MGNTKDSITDEVRDEKKVEAMEDEMKFEDGGSRGDEEEDGEVTSEEGAIKKTGGEQVKTFKAPGPFGRQVSSLAEGVLGWVYRPPPPALVRMAPLLRKARYSMGRLVAMGPSSKILRDLKRETEKEEMVKESVSQEETGGTFEERYVGALESLADSMENLVRRVMTRMRWWLWWW